MRPGGTCTQSNAWTPYSGHSLKRNPGISSAAWYPASPWRARIWSSASFLPMRLVTSPTCEGPTECRPFRIPRTTRATTTRMPITMATGHLRMSVGEDADATQASEAEVKLALDLLAGYLEIGAGAGVEHRLEAGGCAVRFDDRSDPDDRVG